MTRRCHHKYLCAECGRCVDLDYWGNYVHEGGTEITAVCTYCERCSDAQRWDLGSTCPRCLRGKLRYHHTARPEEAP